MAKKTIDWSQVSKDRKVLSRVEELVKEGAALQGPPTKEVCEELNTLTGNNWKPGKYQEYFFAYDFPWTVEEVVYALFHAGKYPEKKQEELYAWNIEESFESDQDVIAYFVMGAFSDDPKKGDKYDQVDVRPFYKELLPALSAWKIEEEWEKNNSVAFRCSKQDNYGCNKILKLYYYGDHRLLNCTFINLEGEEKETVASLLKKYFNHVSSDFDPEAARQTEEIDFSDMFGQVDPPDGNVTREFLEKNWEVSSYNEGTDEQIDYYMNELRSAPGDHGYVYVHEDDELRELEIVHIIAQSDDPGRYEELLQDDDVLINGEEEYGADASAEFIAKYNSYMVWFKELE